MKRRVVSILVAAALLGSAGTVFGQRGPGGSGGPRDRSERGERGEQGGSGGMRDFEGRQGGSRSMREQGSRSRGPGSMMEQLLKNPRMIQMLGITDEQKKALTDGSHALRVEGIDLKAALEKAALEQARLMTADPVDEEALMKAVEETGRIRTELGKMAVRQLMLVRKTLTEEQIAKLHQLRQQRMQHAGPSEGGGERAGGGPRGGDQEGREGPKERRDHRPREGGDSRE